MSVEITLDCPRCREVVDLEVDEVGEGSPICPKCGQRTGYSVKDGITEEFMVKKCIRCGCVDLYWQSDFNRRLGFTLLLAAIGISVWLFWRGWRFLAFLPMALGALIDLALYSWLPVVTICYRCNAQYRRGPLNPHHKPHDLHLQEHYEHEGRKKAEAEGKEFDPRAPQALYADWKPNADDPVDS